MVFAPHVFFTDIGPFGTSERPLPEGHGHLQRRLRRGAARRLATPSWRTPILCLALQFACTRSTTWPTSAQPTLLARPRRLHLARARDSRAGMAGARVPSTTGGSAMTRIDGVPTKSRTRRTAAYRLSRRELGRDVDRSPFTPTRRSCCSATGCTRRRPPPEHRVEERLKALAEIKAAAIVNCEFCNDIASSIAREAGVTESSCSPCPTTAKAISSRAGKARARLRRTR